MDEQTHCLHTHKSSKEIRRLQSSSQSKKNKDRDSNHVEVNKVDQSQNWLWQWVSNQHEETKSPDETQGNQANNYWLSQKVKEQSQHPKDPARCFIEVLISHYFDQESESSLQKVFCHELDWKWKQNQLKQDWAQSFNEFTKPFKFS